MGKRTLVLAIMDGWGVGARDATNPIYIKNPPAINYIKRNYLSGTLQASGIAVGLPWGEVGNSEVGHLTLGAGRVIYQHYPRISIAIRNGVFFKNEVLLKAFSEAKASGKSIHIVGILSAGTVHAASEHMEGLIKLAKQENAPHLNCHFFTDGKDGPVKDGINLLRKLSDYARGINYAGLRIGSIGGRYFGMDRDGHLDRTAKAYEAMTSAISDLKFQISNDNSVEAAVAYLEEQYREGKTDEYIKPAAIDEKAAIKDGDSVIFFNFREDSIRQIVERFAKDLNIGIFKHLNIATFTRYSDKFAFPVAFPPETVTNPLGKIVSNAGKIQLRIAESNKYAHVTYFFNGFTEPPFKNEYRILIPSQNVARHDEHPEMRAEEITNRAVEALSENVYDFILINYANADIVAHTGNYEATLKAIGTVDASIRKLMDAVLKIDGALIVTADHGNAEKVIDASTGMPETKHDISPVPIYIVGKEFMRPKDDFDVLQTEKESAGIISDVAPTILEIMSLPIPPEMTGVSLLRILR